MSTFQITLSNAQSKKLYAAFGNALIEKIFSAENGRKADQELRAHCEAVLTDQLAQVGKKTPVKKAKKAKTSPAKDNSPSKTELKKQQLNEELVTLGGEALPDAGVLEIRKAIKLAKKAAKEAAKEAKKAAKAAKKAASAKKPKKAKKAKSPSKTELKKQQLNKDLVALGGEALPNAGVLEIRKAIKILEKAAKKAAKAASPKVAETFRRLKDKDGNEVHVDNDEEKPWLRVAVNKETREVRKVKPESWTDENNALFDHFYPDSKDPVKAKKAKKAPKQKKAKTLSGEGKKKKEVKALRKAKKAKKAAAAKKAKDEAEKKDLVAKLVADAAQAELDTPTAEEVETIATIAAKAEEEEEEDSDISEDELSDAELSEEELSEDEQSDDDEDDEPVYDEDDVQPWTHKSRPDEELFIDSDFNVWNDEQEHVGTFDSASDTLVED